MSDNGYGDVYGFGNAMADQGFLLIAAVVLVSLPLLVIGLPFYLLYKGVTYLRDESAAMRLAESGSHFVASEQVNSEPMYCFYKVRDGKDLGIYDAMHELKDVGIPEFPEGAQDGVIVEMLGKVLNKDADTLNYYRLAFKCRGKTSCGQLELFDPRTAKRSYSKLYLDSTYTRKQRKREREFIDTLPVPGAHFAYSVDLDAVEKDAA